MSVIRLLNHDRCPRDTVDGSLKRCQRCGDRVAPVGVALINRGGVYVLPHRIVTVDAGVAEGSGISDTLSFIVHRTWEGVGLLEPGVVC